MILWCTLISFLIFSPVVLSFHQDISNFESQFDFISFSPSVQLPGQPVNISCIIYPSSNIRSVTIVETNPKRQVIRNLMTDDGNGKYSYQFTHKMTGRFWFFIEVDSKESGIFQSNLYSFWISSSLDDKDDDGMLDSWETKNGLDPETANDALVDSDLDGYTNHEEFNMKTDPMRNDMIQNVCYHLKEKQSYLFISLLLCFMLCFFSYYGMRRTMV